MAATNLKLLRGVGANDADFQVRGFSLASQCYMCYYEVEDLEHILWSCKMVEKIWD
ncbi:Reverse transcriptase zinc-binding domain [Macleaya cordata]|uniref:Reverse transcriptase zinc-binding domain n=1 Tax=Macleaya cordata TaxID=56857 RepID=A0A200Q197_MACCD|nr:Reverse transcriptase zinc-binding domain [Macleaya cordata]